MLKQHLNLKVYPKVIRDLKEWIREDLLKALAYGGLGIQGIAQTDFYKFISSNDGLSQLGIPPTEPPKLLKAYTTRGFRVSSRSNNTIIIKFGDEAQLKLATPHPADGTGKLQIDSWLEWILDGRTEPRGYVERSNLGQRAQKYIRLKAPLGGLMLPARAYGSSGFWKFPERYKFYDEEWLQQNIGKIQNVISHKLFELVLKYING